MNTKYYCPNCNKIVDSKVVKKLETLNVRRDMLIQLKVKM